MLRMLVAPANVGEECRVTDMGEMANEQDRTLSEGALGNFWKAAGLQLSFLRKRSHVL